MSDSKPRRLLILLLQWALRELQPKPEEPQATHAYGSPAEPAPAASYAVSDPPPTYATAPVRSRVEVPASRENPRPLRGREKFREQRHLAHCKPGECRLEAPESCPVASGLEASYF